MNPDDDDRGTGAINGGDPQQVTLTCGEYERYLLGALNPPPLDDVLLAYLQFAPPRPEPDPTWRPTTRQRYRIWKDRQLRRIHQAIHDRLTHANCDC